MACVVSRHAQRHDTSQTPMQKKVGDVHWLSPSDAPRSSAAGQREGPGAILLAGPCLHGCQISQRCKERGRLADEKPTGRQGIGSGHCCPLCLGRTNDRADREATAEKDGGLGHDQVGLEILPAKWRFIEVRKNQPIRGVRQRNRIARLVMPRLKVCGLGRADAEQNT